MVIGITGGVGCGKSAVLSILEEDFNAHIIDADKVAHRLTTILWCTTSSSRMVLE